MTGRSVRVGEVTETVASCPVSGLATLGDLGATRLPGRPVRDRRDASTNRLSCGRRPPRQRPQEPRRSPLERSTGSLLVLEAVARARARPNRRPCPTAQRGPASAGPFSCTTQNVHLCRSGWQSPEAIANHPALSLDVPSDNGNREVDLTRLPLGRTMGLPRAWEARQRH